MAPRNPADDFLQALSDDRVCAKLHELFNKQLKLALAELAEIKTENTKLKNELTVANAKIEELEAYNRRENLVISGVPLESYSEASQAASSDMAGQPVSENSAVTEQSVLALCQQLELPITSTDISVAHRLRKRNGQPPAIIVRFTNRKARDMLYRARFQLKRPEHRRGLAIYINEDLTKNAAELFAKARKLVKDNVIHSAWTSSGVVHIKQYNTPTCRPIRILKASDLPAPSPESADH